MRRFVASEAHERMHQRIAVRHPHVWVVRVAGQGYRISAGCALVPLDPIRRLHCEATIVEGLPGA